VEIAAVGGSAKPTREPSPELVPGVNREARGDPGSASSSPAVEFCLLGPVQVRFDGRPVPLGRPGTRAVLGLLLLEANQVVPVCRIVDALWERERPPSARTIVHGHVSRLRKLLAPVEGQARIVTCSPGYMLQVDPHLVDLHRARELVARARTAPPEQRVELLREALGLWRGPALSELPELVRRSVAADADELRLVAVEERIDAELELARHVPLVAELQGLVSEHPYRERLVAQLMLALYRSGRRADALAAYQDFRTRAVHELGIDPGPELQELHQRVLRDDPVLRAPTVQRAVVPAQLPPAPGGFTGRRDELAELDGLLAERGTAGAPVVAVLTGPAGVGKTALALTWSHRMAAEFPDGRLFVSLRGFDPAQPPVDPGEVLTRFLVALGVPESEVPVAPDEREALYRSLLAERRVLVLLDDARDSEQVLPLLGGGADSLVLVTSRVRLDGLVVRHGARVLPLAELPPPVAVELVDRAAGARRGAREPEALRELARLCGYLPLALRIAAARLAARPRQPVSDLVAELADEHNRLQALDVGDGDTSVRGAFDVSFRNLDPQHARMFLLLGLVAAPSVSPPVVAALAGVSERVARRALHALIAAHLVVEPELDRFGMHDLIRLHARELARSELSEAERRTAVEGLLRYYLVGCDHARRFLRTPRDQLDPAERFPEAPRPPVRDREEALAWFDAEWRGIVAAVRLAAETGLHESCWQLARLVVDYGSWRARWTELAANYELGLVAARACGDRAAEALVLKDLGFVMLALGRTEEALAHSRESHRIAVELGDTVAGFNALNNIAAILAGLERFDEAIGAGQEAVCLARQAADPFGEATALNNLALSYINARRHTEAAETYRQALAIYREVGDTESEALVLNNLGETLVGLGDLPEAENCFSAALRLAEQDGMVVHEANARRGLGDVRLAMGDVAGARVQWEQALARSREAGAWTSDLEALAERMRRLGDGERQTSANSDV